MSQETIYRGAILSLRAIEDAIRATRKYTEGVGTTRKKHPIQGEDFPSKVFCKYYEVYPDVELNWDMPARIAMDWVWGDTKHIDVIFKYDYRGNNASVSIRDGAGAVKELEYSIPGFKEALSSVKVAASGQKSKYNK
jgi:hypothetical protein